jgi:hypothetical protein
MSATLLAEKPWKDILKDNDIKDNGLQRALGAYERAPEDKYNDRLGLLKQIVMLAGKLDKNDDVGNCQDAADYIYDLVREAAKVRPMLEKAAKEAASGKGKPADGHQSRSTFIRSSDVKELSNTTQIINQIFPYFPRKFQVISGYLSPGDLYWKVNYHWDAMRTWLEYAKDDDQMSEDEQKKLNDIYKVLMSNPPSKLGHYKVNKIGEPTDSSSQSKIEDRCVMLQKLKAELTAYAQKQDFFNKNMRQKEVLKYSLNPLALPKQSNHVYGWALDIAGDIPAVATIAKSLGASLAFKEFTHCHCEFRNGVRLPA